jgi:F-type H+/Na+-transporting ATPase subunit alpha
MDLKPAEVTDVLKRELKNYRASLKVENVGTVLSVGDGVARIYGLDKCMMSEILEFPNDVFGMALNLEQDNVGAVLFGSETRIKEGDEVRTTGRLISVPTGPKLLGRVVNALGQPVDGKGPIDVAKDDWYPCEGRAPNVVERQPVKEPMMTGLKAIDAMIPIGRGQRELIIGDRQTGKTAICVDAMLNQKNTDVVCIYVAIGQKMSTVKSVVRSLEQGGVMEKCIVVNAPASDQASMQFLAPFSGAAMGERFRDEGGHVLVIYDDLYKHATAWRQVSLLLRRPPGREAFPGDIFNLHSRLLERAAKINVDAPKLNPQQFKKGGGSLTALPIVETQDGDVSAYIPTNVISITDGQIFLETDLFNSGIRPAVNVGISVSRVGGSAQTAAMKKVAGGLRINLAQYRALAAFAQFGSDLDAATQQQLTRGERLTELLKQGQYQPMAMEKQIVSVYAGTAGALDTYPTAQVGEFEKGLHRFIEDRSPKILEKLRTEGKLTDEVKGLLDGALAEWKQMFASRAGKEAKAAEPAKPAAAPAAAEKPKADAKPSKDAHH